MEEDPWNALEETFVVGSKHEGTVVKKDEKGSIIQLPYGLEGFAFTRQLVKEDGKSMAAEETGIFVVTEFDRNDKRLLVSHTRTWEQAKKDEKEIAKKEAKASADEAKKEVKKVQSKVEKSALGDIDTSADVKKKMKKGDKKED